MAQLWEQALLRPPRGQMRQDGAVISVVQDGCCSTPASSVHGISSGFFLLLINVCGGESTCTHVYIESFPSLTPLHSISLAKLRKTK